MDTKELLIEFAKNIDGFMSAKAEYMECIRYLANAEIDRR